MSPTQRPSLSNLDIFSLAYLSLPNHDRDAGRIRTVRPERPQLPIYPWKEDSQQKQWVDKAFQTPAQRRWKEALEITLRKMGSHLQVFTFAWIENIATCPHGLPALGPILTSTTAILYDISSRPDPEATRRHARQPAPVPVEYMFIDALAHRNPMLPALLEHMLLKDYGLGEYPLRKPWHVRESSSRRKWRPALYRLAEELTTHALPCGGSRLPVFRLWFKRNDYIKDGKLHRVVPGGDVADVALMLYYFHTHRRKISVAEYNVGLTGYTGVVEEMVGEIPSVGSDRLLRKLSVDRSLMLGVVRNEGLRAKMHAVIEEIAEKYGILEQLRLGEVGSMVCCTAPSDLESSSSSNTCPPKYGDHFDDERISISSHEDALEL